MNTFPEIYHRGLEPVYGARRPALTKSWSFLKHFDFYQIEENIRSEQGIIRNSAWRTISTWSAHYNTKARGKFKNYESLNIC